MANNCLTHFVIECENKEKLERIHDAITKCNESEYKPSDGSWCNWTGNIFKELGLKYESDRSFWVASDLDDGALHIYEDAAWTRGSAMRQLVEQMDDTEDMSVYFFSEEPGCEIYQSNDDCHLHFSEEYVLDTNEDGIEYFEYASSLIEKVGEHVGEKLDFYTFGALEEYLAEYNKKHTDDDRWAYVHEVDYSVSLYD